jgi:hypothetical protein
MLHPRLLLAPLLCTLCFAACATPHSPAPAPVLKTFFGHPREGRIFESAYNKHYITVTQDWPPEVIDKLVIITGTGNDPDPNARPDPFTVGYGPVTPFTVSKIELTHPAP